MGYKKQRKKPKKKCPECGQEVVVRPYWGTKKALLHCRYCSWQKIRRQDDYPDEEDMAEPW